MQTVWTQIKTERMFDLMFDTLIWYYLLKNSLKRVDFGKKSADNKIATNITLHAKTFFKSVSLKCVLERCETAIKTNGPLYKHLKLGVSPNLLKVLN